MRRPTPRRSSVLRRAAGARFSCRAFLPHPVPRATIERILDGGAKNRVVVQQPAVAIGDRQRRGKELSATRCMRAASSAKRRSRLSAPARISRRLSASAAAKAAFSFTTRSASPEATRRLTPGRRWRISISSARRTSPSFIPTRRSASTARSIAAAMSRTSCWPRRRWASATMPQAALAFHSEVVRRHFGLGRRSQRGLRHFVRIRRPRAQGQQLPHLARQPCGHCDVRRRIATARKAPIAEAIGVSVLSAERSSISRCRRRR